MIYGKRYVQFNNLVIDSYDMISETDTNVSFKYTSHDRTYGHGKYAPLKRNYMFTDEIKVSLTLKLHTKKLPCDQQKFYRTFALSELVKPGKLWAVQNGELIWAYAVLTQYGEVDVWRKDLITITADFTLPEGVWHKADKQKTFLRPYDVCSFMDCYDFRELDPCAEDRRLSGDCCETCGAILTEIKDAGCDCCFCDSLDKEMALCYMKEDLLKAYGQCDDGIDFQIVYNCQKGQEFFGNDYLGQKFCEKEACSGVIAGLIYSETDIPTSNYTIILHGHFKNPAITINRNTNVIEGDWENENGILTIHGNGDVYYRKDDCCEDELVSASAWKIPEGMNYGWELHAGNNRLVIHTNSCCGRTCAYIQIDNLTI